MRPERRGRVMQPSTQVNRQREELAGQAKPYRISKQQVYEAYLRVKANKGAAGIDDETLEAFESKLKDNLYRIWNRMSSGSYFPPAVKAVEIPKANGKTRLLGIPTVADRVAQTVVKMQLEPVVEPKFHPDSYGYRPGKSAHQALATARQRCWKYNWVIDIDVRAFFDNLDHELTMKAVRHHTDEKWVLLYIERWLKAPLQTADGLQARGKGTPQGGVVSPLIANIFMHHAFDDWMRRHYADVPFERYADDLLAHCRSFAEAQRVLESIRERLRACGLELHPEKTKIVYCKDEDRRGHHEPERFDFLGYTFRPRLSKNRWGKTFVNFSPAISDKAAKAIRAEIRSWHIGKRSDKTLNDLAHMFNATVRGWINYYGAFYRSMLYPSLRQLEYDLVLWAKRKYKRLRRHHTRAIHWLGQIARREPQLFEHWKLGLRSPVA
ncbi:MAG: group II intron reverse transcriptase/maturase [Deltaproteobacteria bacterium]|nr:group II intron reverse transcriptase/maturase [Deltaproteobacteria bacterium]